MIDCHLKDRISQQIDLAATREINKKGCNLASLFTLRLGLSRLVDHHGLLQLKAQNVFSVKNNFFVPCHG